MEMTNFGREIRKARIATKTSLKDLGDFTGKGPAYHSGLECQRSRITDEDVINIADFFNDHGYKGATNWRELAEEANSFPLRDLKKELEGARVFSCPTNEGA